MPLFPHCRARFVGTAAVASFVLPIVAATTARAQAVFAPLVPIARNSATTAPADPKASPTLYVVTYSHLDTEWCWTYRDSIEEYIPNTLKENFALFEKYPHYTFNWTGANRYRFIRDYYPEEYTRLKQYVAAGRWVPTGSAWDENDAIVPAPESIIRSILYSNRWFEREFGKTSNQYMMPDTFGFPASLPTVLAHCGLKGFSTKKLTYGAGAAVGVPFNIGRWIGPDGQSVVAALNPGDYRTRVTEDLSQSATWLARLEENRKRGGVAADYMYHGNGDVGGSPGEESARWLETSLAGVGPVRVSAGSADDFFTQMTPSQSASLPTYRGDLLLIQHSAGSINSGAAMKRWNHQNEHLADAAERAALSARLVTGVPYPTEWLTDAWERFLGGQMHDILPGTSIPQAYELAWNDQVVALNRFADVARQSIGAVAARLNTRTKGVPLVVYNPLSITRDDVVCANVVFAGDAPANVTVIGPDGIPTPAQVQSRAGKRATVLFLARVPSVGCAVFEVRPAPATEKTASALRVTPNQIENARYRVRLNASGDVAEVYDKAEKRQLLSAPVRLAFLHEKPQQHPAWNMDWADRQQPPTGFVDGPAKITVLENGPARVALQVEREARGSRFVQIIRLGAGTAGNRVEFQTNVDWRTTESSLKAVFPLSVSNPQATYNEGIGTVQRGNNDPKKYEVPAQEWFDLTDTGGNYGVSVLNEAKYGSDKPDDNTLRLTLLYTPGVRDRFQYQGTQDWGHHEIRYAIQGHHGDWRSETPEQATRFNQPLLVFQTTPHTGERGRAFSLLRVTGPGVLVAALKKAEDSNEIIVRFLEARGLAVQNARVTLAAPILRVREVNGQERPTAPSGKAERQNGSLVFDMKPYRPRTFALTLATPARSLLPSFPQTPLPLPLGKKATAADMKPVASPFDKAGNTYPVTRIPATLESGGVSFRLSQNALVCAGQRLAVPKAERAGERYLYVLASSAESDVSVPFTFGVPQSEPVPLPLTVQNWDGFVGQWDTRIWVGEVPPKSAVWHNEVVGVQPGYIKPAPIAWYSDHRIRPDGKNDAYHFCYLFRYALPIPNGADSVTLPSDSRVRVFAATVASAPAAWESAFPLYDALPITSNP